jgi:hypothetical protein
MSVFGHKKNKNNKGELMLRKISFGIGLLSLVLFICGCVSTSTTTTAGGSSAAKPVQAGEKKGLEIRPPAIKIVDLDSQPAHVKFVIAAMINRMRGNRDKIPEVVFAPEGKHAFYDKNFTYDDFRLFAVQITGFKVKKQTKNEAECVIEGIFDFTDLFNRRVADYFAADYTVKHGGITINKSATALIAPSLPDIQVYYVPKSSFKGMNMKEISSFMDLYIHALTNAFTMTPTQEEIKNKQAYEKLSVWKKMVTRVNSKPEDCFIMLFCKDRLPAYASLEMKITDASDTGGTEFFEPLTIDDNGWRAVISGGTFSVNVLNNNFYVNVFYNANPGINPKPVRIGLYMNRKNYANSPGFIVKYEKGSEKQQQINKQAASAPIESGSVFLDPRHKGDAKLIQSRLKELGYYTKSIDGKFGPGSRKALEKFKKARGLGNGAVWDLKTQKLLFENSGQ